MPRAMCWSPVRRTLLIFRSRARRPRALTPAPRPTPSFSPSSLVYSTYLGGELQDEGRAIAVAPNGTVYVAGSTESTQFPLEGNSYRNTLQGGIDVWIARMDLTKSGNASMNYSTYLG